MTPIFTVNLLRVLFVTFCGVVGSLISSELLEQTLPGLLVGILAWADRCPGGQTFEGDLPAGIFVRHLRSFARPHFRQSSERIAGFTLSIGNRSMVGAVGCLRRFRLLRDDAGDAEQSR